MDTTSTTHMGRISGWHLPILGVGAVLAVLLLVLMLGSSEEVAQASSTTWTASLDSERHSNGREYGYGYGFGTLTPDSFQHNGTTYTVDYLKWDLRDSEVEFGLDNCLDPSLFTSLQVGSATYPSPHYIRQEASECADDPTRNQEFEFHKVSNNPLTINGTFTITFNIGGGSSTTSTTTSTTSSCLTQLKPSPGTPLVADGTWTRNCDSENRSGSKAKFYSFTLAQMADVQVDLIAARSYDPYLFLLEGSGTAGSEIASDDNGGPLNRDSRITTRLLPGTYTIEATTYRSRITGDFRIKVTVTPMAAKRVATTTVKFGQSLTQPKGLAWDGSTLYMVDDGTDALYKVATSTGVATRVSTRTTRFGLSARSVSPRGLAWDGSTLYMTTRDKLYTLDRTTGVATLVGSYGTKITDASGISWKRDPAATSTGVTVHQSPGRLYMADRATDALYIVNTATGSSARGQATRVDSSVVRFGLNIGSTVGLEWVGPDLYMMSAGPGTMYRVDEVAGEAISLGTFGITSPTDIAWDGSRLYALDDSTNALYTISGIRVPEPPRPVPGIGTKQTGSAVRFGLTDVTLNAPRGLMMINKDLYMVENNTDFLYTVNRETGVAGKVGSAGLSRSAIQARGIAWDGTNIYMLTPSSLYKINRAYGTASRVGALGSGITDAHGLAWDGEKLYMVDRRTDALYTVATSTGAASRVNKSLSRFGAYVSSPSGLTWVGPSTSEVEDDNELPSLYMGSAEGKLYKVNKETGRAAYVARLGKGDVTGLAWFDDSSTLYFVGDTSDALHIVTGLHRFLPNAGDLFYSGVNFADGFVRWDNPSWVQSSQCKNDPLKCSTYEHDLKLEWKNGGGWFNLIRIPYFGRISGITEKNYSPFCTAWSDLPKGYDDCPTAGVLAEDDLVELSFGTFKAPLIEAGRDYYGFWIFKSQLGGYSTTDVKLYGQEGKYDRGDDRNIHCRTIVAEERWCVGGRQQGSILESGTTWSYGTPSYTTYSRP